MVRLEHGECGGFRRARRIFRRSVPRPAETHSAPISARASLRHRKSIRGGYDRRDGGIRGLSCSILREGCASFRSVRGRSSSRWRRWSRHQRSPRRRGAMAGATVSPWPRRWPMQYPASIPAMARMRIGHARNPTSPKGAARRRGCRSIGPSPRQHLFPCRNHDGRCPTVRLDRRCDIEFCRIVME